MSLLLKILLPILVLVVAGTVALLLAGARPPTVQQPSPPPTLLVDVAVAHRQPVTFVVRFMTMPMHVFGSLGLISTLCGSVICAYVALLRYEHGNIQNRHPLLMLGILLIIVGIQCFSIGFLGDMIASMHQRGGRTPRIAESLNG